MNLMFDSYRRKSELCREFLFHIKTIFSFHHFKTPPRNCCHVKLMFSMTPKIEIRRRIGMNISSIYLLFFLIFQLKPKARHKRNQSER